LTQWTPGDSCDAQPIKTLAVEEMHARQSNDGITTVDDVKADHAVGSKSVLVNCTCMVVCMRGIYRAYHKGSVGTLPGNETLAPAAHAVNTSRGILLSILIAWSAWRSVSDRRGASVAAGRCLQYLHLKSLASPRCILSFPQVSGDGLTTQATV